MFHLKLCSCHANLNAALGLQQQGLGGQFLRNPSRCRFYSYSTTCPSIRLPV